MSLRFGFVTGGDFIAVDTVTKAAERAYRHSDHWRAAKADAAAAAAEMVAGCVTLRQRIPELPSHQPPIWDANYAALASLIEGEGEV